MRLRSAYTVAGAVLLAAALLGAAREDTAPTPYVPSYTAAGDLRAPAGYRDWVFLTSGFDMAYSERASGVPEHSVFDNVFVNPEAYRVFQKTGTWPDKTVMVLENRVARSQGEVLVKGGRFQGSEITGMEIHVKDSTRFHRVGSEGTWGFFDVTNGVGKVFEPTAICYTCHHDHAAVDTTFVQFYPTLMPVAETRGTISPLYKKEQAPSAAGR